MKVRQKFDATKYTSCTTCIIYNGTDEFEVNIVDITDSAIYMYDPTNCLFLYKKHNEQYVQMGWSDKELFTFSPDFELYVYVEDINIWVNIYINFITGQVTSGKGKYQSREDAVKNIKIPGNCRYVSTILCE